MGRSMILLSDTKVEAIWSCSLYTSLAEQDILMMFPDIRQKYPAKLSGQVSESKQ